MPGNSPEDTINKLLTCQLFIIRTQFHVPNYASKLNGSLNRFFSCDSRFNLMKFNKLVSDNSFTLPNLFIEELVNPSQVSEDFFRNYDYYPHYFTGMKGNEEAMRVWLCEFYTAIVPTLCCILNPDYDFSETFKIYMPETYRTITQKEAPVGGDVNIKNKLNIQKIDEIITAEYLKKTRG
jgi:hypothetical protein